MSRIGAGGALGWPLHPLLLAALPIATAYAEFPGRSDLGEIALALVVTVGAVAAIWGAFALLFRDPRKVAIVMSAVIALYLVVPERIADILRRRNVLALALLVVAALAVWLWRTRAPLVKPTALLNVVAAGLLIPPVGALARFHLSAVSPAERRGPPVEIPQAGTPAARPDIYYLIFDRYGDADTLARHYGISNEPLYQFLTARGFYVARGSRANYIKTALSVASSLNMTYHDDIARQLGPDSGNWLPINFRLREHAVGRFLKSQGYRYIHLGSWWWPTLANPMADEQINFFDTVPNPVMRLFNQPLVRWVAASMESPLVDERLQQWHRVRRQVAALEGVVRQDGPKFVFVHFLLPHPPWVFDRDGSYVSFDQENRRTQVENYRNQVVFANQVIRAVVEQILSGSPAEPVIILQSDEGPYPPGIGGDRADLFRWRDLTPEQLLERTGILNAYLLPGGSHGLWQSISPVNSFRVVFNRYFGTKLPLLPDRTYRHDSENRPYAFEDVTEGIREALASSARISLAVTPLPD